MEIIAIFTIIDQFKITFMDLLVFLYINEYTNYFLIVVSELGNRLFNS